MAEFRPTSLPFAYMSVSLPTISLQAGWLLRTVRGTSDFFPPRGLFFPRLRSISAALLAFRPPSPFSTSQTRGGKTRVLKARRRSGLRWARSIPRPPLRSFPPLSLRGDEETEYRAKGETVCICKGRRERRDGGGGYTSTDREREEQRSHVHTTTVRTAHGARNLTSNELLYIQSRERKCDFCEQT